MPELQPGGGPEVATPGELAEPAPSASAVRIITHDRMPDRGEMDTNLMCAPSVQVRAQQVSRIEARQPGEVRPRRPSSTDDRHALSVSRIASDRLVDSDSVFGDVAPRQRRVATYDAPRLH